MVGGRIRSPPVCGRLVRRSSSSIASATTRTVGTSMLKVPLRDQRQDR
ncbi:hypothetical protein [Amycolatopsis thermophila]|uniref:Uncharacterized protein n=1 Tax=Amycolatopsis thermophila TaxID=206084 RepID=A0ABU0EVT0_9PSEU|nr:hypothetical protein [Amycolatopsis thermophila]MDQ0379428.1 hypothetical protein [Amycolatopsis thermophila]